MNYCELLSIYWTSTSIDKIEHPSRSHNTLILKCENPQSAVQSALRRHILLLLLITGQYVPLKNQRNIMF